MLILNRRSELPASDRVALAYDQRKRSRLRVTLASGREAGIFLERGDHLRANDRLLAEDGATVVAIDAAPERLIEALADSPLLFARAAYHLGNRHVPVEIVPDPAAAERGGSLRFQADHVLAEMVAGLGCRTREIDAPFQPESGAYGAHGGHHHHGDEATGEHEHGADLHHPGHGPHRSLPRIHQFKPAAKA